MTTPVRQHQLRVRAAVASAATPYGEPVQGSAYELMLAQLYEHRRRLHDLKSVERKIEAKATFVATYDPWIDGVLSTGQGAQDVVLTTLLVWHLDVGNFERALQIADYAVAHKLSMPDQYDRDLCTVLIDELSSAALAGKLPAEHAVTWLARVHNLTEEADTHDQARAKLHKAIAYAHLGKSTTHEIDFKTVSLVAAQVAMPQLIRAYALFEGVGVKKDIERLERRLSALAEQADPPRP